MKSDYVPSYNAIIPQIEKNKAKSVKREVMERHKNKVKNIN